MTVATPTPLLQLAGGRMVWRQQVRALRPDLPHGHADQQYAPDGYWSCWFYCPGCECAHRYQWHDGSVSAVPTPGIEPVWQWNGSIEQPSFTPSLVCRGQRRCHLFVTDGQIQFCGDSEHALAGQTVPLPPLPDWLQD